MFKIGNTELKDIKKRYDFADTKVYSSKEGKYVYKNAPRLYIKAKYNDKVVMLMVDVFLTYQELYNFELNKVVDMTDYLIGIYYFTDYENNPNFPTEDIDLNENEVLINLERLSDSKFHFILKISNFDIKIDEYLIEQKGASYGN